MILRTEDDCTKLEVEDECDRMGARNLGFSIFSEPVWEWAEKNQRWFATVKVGAQAGLENEEAEGQMISYMETLKLGSGHQLINAARVNISRRTANQFSMADEVHGYIPCGAPVEDFWNTIFPGKFGLPRSTSDAVLSWLNNDANTGTSTSSRSRLSTASSDYSSGSSTMDPAPRRILELSRDSAVEECIALRMEKRLLVQQRDALIRERSRTTSAYANLKLRYMVQNKSIMIRVRKWEES